MIQQGDSRDYELQNLLADERNRCNQYKEIYQSLKGTNAKLQDELTLIYDRLKESVAQNERIKAANDTNVRKFENTIKEQRTEISSLLGRLKAYDEKNMHTLVFEEATSHYEVKIKELTIEVDKMRDQYNSLHYEHAILRCNFDGRETEYSRTLERIHLQHQGEIEHLKSKIESYEKLSPSDSFAVELKSSKREVLQLNSKIKLLLSECEELRAQNDNLTLQIGSINLTLSKQISDHLTNIRSLESEKQKAHMQKEVLDKELLNAQEHRKRLSEELQVSQREVLSLKNRVEECEHKAHMKITNLQVDLEQWKIEKQSEQELFLDEISRLKSELQTLHSNLSQERQSMIVKEKDLQENLSVAKQQFWKQSIDRNQEKDQLEKKLRELESERESVFSQMRHEIESLKQKLHLCAAAKTELENELSTLKNQLAEVPLNQSDNYQKEIAVLKEKIDLLSTADQRGNAHNVEHKSNICLDHEVMELKLSWEQQKLQYLQRLEEVEAQLRESFTEKKKLEMKVKLYSKEINKLRERLEHVKAQNEELDSQKDMLERNVPPEIHIPMKNQLMDLQKRLEKYHLLITAEPSKMVFAEKNLADIKNIQAVPFKVSKESIDGKENETTNTTQKYYSKKPLHPHRKLKSKYTAKKETRTAYASPIISSSSELDLEKL